MVVVVLTLPHPCDHTRIMGHQDRRASSLQHRTCGHEGMTKCNAGPKSPHKSGVQQPGRSGGEVL